MEWKWLEEHKAAFEAVKREIVARPAVYNPDYQRPFFIDVDASDVGCGGVLYQVADGKDSMKTENKQVVMYVSQAWRGAMLDRPIYYKEARGMIVVLGKCRIIISNALLLYHRRAYGSRPITVDQVRSQRPVGGLAGGGAL